MSTQYKKQNPTEEITAGQILMISPKTQKVTKAIRDYQGINERLVIGIVTGSDNSTLLPLKIDGGSSKAGDKSLIYGGSSEISVIPILGGMSNIVTREYVEVASSGVEIVKIDIPPHTKVRVGDKLTISRKTAGNAEVMRVTNNHPFGNRSIGKVIEIINEEQVKVLINIE